MVSYIFETIGLVVFVWLMYRMTRGWHRPSRGPMRASRRWMALVAFAGGMYLLVTCISDYTARRMDVYTMSLRTAAESKVFADQIGEPYSVEWPISLSAEATDTDGNPAFRAKVKGPAGKGALVAAGKKENRVWRLTQLGLIPSSTRQYVSLLPMQTVQT